jgi:hypothetical protein
MGAEKPAKGEIIKEIIRMKKDISIKIKQNQIKGVKNV